MQRREWQAPSLNLPTPGMCQHSLHLAKALQLWDPADICIFLEAFYSLCIPARNSPQNPLKCNIKSLFKETPTPWPTVEWWKASRTGSATILMGIRMPQSKRNIIELDQCGRKLLEMCHFSLLYPFLTLGLMETKVPSCSWE